MPTLRTRLRELNHRNDNTTPAPVADNSRRHQRWTASNAPEHVQIGGSYVSSQKFEMKMVRPFDKELLIRPETAV
jgi:hypothetical protein